MQILSCEALDSQAVWILKAKKRWKYWWRETHGSSIFLSELSLLFLCDSLWRDLCCSAAAYFFQARPRVYIWLWESEVGYVNTARVFPQAAARCPQRCSQTILSRPLSSLLRNIDIRITELKKICRVYAGPAEAETSRYLPFTDETKFISSHRNQKSME